MKVELTEDQRSQIAGILATHLHNMRNEFVAAHGVDQSRADFYHAKLKATEMLIPIFSEAAEPEDEDNSEDADDEDDLETKAE